jgi:DNA-binding winged helix-turn-helix (wHTH) protein/Tol biopolymer transport system component
MAGPLLNRKIYRFGLFELDARAAELRKGGSLIKLQTQPLKILIALLEQPGEVVTRDQLRSTLWPSDTFVDFEQGLKVTKLRRALADPAENPRFVETLARTGYRFIAPLQIRDRDETPAPVVAITPASEVPPELIRVSGSPALRLVKTQSEAELAEFPAPAQPFWKRRRLWIVATACTGLGALAAFLVLTLAPHPAPPPVMRLSIVPPPGAGVEHFALSPDGRYLAFTASTEGRNMLWIQALDLPSANMLAGTEGAAHPFWSPDSRSVGYFTPGGVLRVGVTGGPPQWLGPASVARGGAWGPDGTILYANRTGPIIRIIGAHEKPQPVTELNAARKESAHLFPQFLPDGRHFLYLAVGPHERSEIYLASLDSKQSRFLMESDSAVIFAPDSSRNIGHLLFSYRGALLSQPFDLRSHSLTGAQSQVTPDIPNQTGWLNASASTSGVLAWRGVPAHNRRFAWFDRNGRNLGFIGEPNSFNGWSFSLDESRVVASQESPAGGTASLWTMDVRTGATSRLDTGEDPAGWPVWSADGSEVLYNAGPSQEIRRFSLRHPGAETVIPGAPLPQFLGDSSGDGKYLAFFRFGAGGTRIHIAELPPAGHEAAIHEVDDRPGRHANPHFSPASPGHPPRWLAYDLLENQRPEIYVRNFPATDRQWRISTQGGWLPHWRGDGQELFFLKPDGMIMAVDAGGTDEFHVGVPHELFRAAVPRWPDYPGIPNNVYAVSRDGQRFLINSIIKDPLTTPITVLTRWNPPSK